MKHKLIKIKGKTGKPIIIVQHSAQCTELVGRTISNHIEIPNNTTNQLDLTDIYRIFHPTTEENTFCSNTQRMLLGIDMLDHKPDPNKF